MSKVFGPDWIYMDAKRARDFIAIMGIEAKEAKNQRNKNGNRDNSTHSRNPRKRY